MSARICLGYRPKTGYFQLLQPMLEGKHLFWTRKLTGVDAVVRNFLVPHSWIVVSNISTSYAQRWRSRPRYWKHWESNAFSLWPFCTSSVAGKPSTATGIHDGDGRNVGFFAKGPRQLVLQPCRETTWTPHSITVKVQKVQSWHLAPPGDVSGAFCYHGQGGKHDDSATSRGCEWCLFCW